MTHPTIAEIEQLHRKYASGVKAFDSVFPHCTIVWEIAESCIAAKQLHIDRELVRAGALLHDIGAYRLIDTDGVHDEANYIKHGIYGYEMLKSEGLPEEICRFAKYHTGVGITTDDIINKHLPIPVENYFAETPEEKLVMYADKFHSKTPIFHTFDFYRNSLAKFGEIYQKKFDEFAELFSIPNIPVIAKKHNAQYD